jgi:CRP-like cAMP-binding protein
MDLVAHFHNARKVVSLPGGAVLFGEGDPGTAMYVLLEGSAAVTMRGKPLEILKPGSIVGELSMLDGSPRSATVLTRSPCRFVAIEPDEFDLLIRETPGFARVVMRAMADRLRRTNERVQNAYDTRL